MTNYLTNHLKIKHTHKQTGGQDTGQCCPWRRQLVPRSAGPDARSVVPGHCGRLQLHKGLGSPGPRPLLGCYNPLPSRPDITSRTPQTVSAQIYSQCENIYVLDLWVVMDAVTQHFSLYWAPRCYENQMYSANFERILQLELFWVGNCWHRERWQRRGRSEPEQEFTTEGGEEGCWSGLCCDKTKFNNSNIMSSISCGSPRATGRNNIDRY